MSYEQHPKQAQSKLTSFFPCSSSKISKGPPSIKQTDNLKDQVTPQLSDVEEENPLQKKRIEHSLILYITPNHIEPLWKQIKTNFSELNNLNNLTSFKVQSAIEEIYKSHFNLNENLSRRIKFSNIKKAIDSFEQKKMVLTALSNAARLAQKINSIFQDFLHIVKSDINVELTYEQVGCLIANMFFCTLHKQPEWNQSLPKIFIMALLFQDETNEIKLKVKLEKIFCILNYFIQIQNFIPKGKLKISKCALKKDKLLNIFPAPARNKEINYIEKDQWKSCKLPLCEVIVKHNGRVEDEPDALIVDFANKFIGGGVLSNGCVQEEILFLTHIPMMVSILITPKLERDEALLIQGVQRFSNFNGYGDSFKWQSWDYRQDEFLNFTCIDARDYKDELDWVQYQDSEVNQELTKAFVGFNVSGNETISTGRWGCGVFKGDWQLKLFIQILAASAAGCKRLIFYNVGNESQEQKLILDFFQKIYLPLKLQNVGTLYQKILLWCKSYIDNKQNEQDLINYLSLF